jgi:hypothetical protein
MVKHGRITGVIVMRDGTLCVRSTLGLGTGGHIVECTDQWGQSTWRVEMMDETEPKVIKQPHSDVYRTINNLVAQHNAGKPW